MVAQLIGALDKNGKYIQGSCQFIEASWVQNPAFQGAVLNYFLYEDDINLLAASIASKKLASGAKVVLVQNHSEAVKILIGNISMYNYSLNDEKRGKLRIRADLHPNLYAFLIFSKDLTI